MWVGRKVALRGQKFIKKVNLGRKVDLGRKNNFFKIALNRVLILPKARSRKMRQFPLYYCFTKQKHIRGERTLNKSNFGPNVI